MTCRPDRRRIPRRRDRHRVPARWFQLTPDSVRSGPPLESSGRPVVPRIRCGRCWSQPSSPSLAAGTRWAVGGELLRRVPRGISCRSCRPHAGRDADTVDPARADRVPTPSMRLDSLPTDHDRPSSIAVGPAGEPGRRRRERVRHELGLGTSPSAPRRSLRADFVRVRHDDRGRPGRRRERGRYRPGERTRVGITAVAGSADGYVAIGYADDRAASGMTVWRQEPGAPWERLARDPVFQDARPGSRRAYRVRMGDRRRDLRSGWSSREPSGTPTTEEPGGGSRTVRRSTSAAIWIRARDPIPGRIARIASARRPNRRGRQQHAGRPVLSLRTGCLAYPTTDRPWEQGARPGPPSGASSWPWRAWAPGSSRSVVTGQPDTDDPILRVAGRRRLDRDLGERPPGRHGGTGRRTGREGRCRRPDPLTIASRSRPRRMVVDWTTIHSEASC